MRTLLKAACLAALIAPAWVHAQGAGNYPSRPITVIMPVEPGGAHEVEVRAWTELMSSSMGQTIVRVFRPGAGNVTGLLELANAKPDGYMLGSSPINIALVPLRYDNPPFDPIKSFEQIAELNKRLSALTVSAQLPIHNIKEYIAYARAHPGALNYSTSGEGSVDHISGLLLMSATGTELTFIHYKSAGAQTQDLLAGRTHLIAIAISSGGAFAAMMQGGKVRALGTQSLQRSPLLPDVPTLDEQGVADFDVPSFVGLQAPAKTPAAIIDKLHAEVVKASKNPELQKRVGPGTVIVASTPEEYRKKLQGVTERYRQLSRQFNIDMKGN